MFYITGSLMHSLICIKQLKSLYFNSLFNTTFMKFSFIYDFSKMLYDWSVYLIVLQMIMYDFHLIEYEKNVQLMFTGKWCKRFTFFKHVFLCTYRIERRIVSVIDTRIIFERIELVLVLSYNAMSDIMVVIVW